MRWLPFLVLGLSGCLRSTSFHCTDNASCGAAGTCESTGYCSFPDGMCAGGHRYGDSAGSLSGTCVGGTTDIDAGKDTGGGGMDCYGTGLQNICLTSPAASLTINAAIDTDTDTRCIGAYPMVCAIGATAVTVSGTVVASGSKPLVLVAATTLTVSGTLDVSSKAVGGAGAGARGACGTTADGAAGTGGGGGGGGGTFGGAGGNGGNGDSGNANNAGGTAAAPTAQTMLVGGCGGN